MHLRPLEPFGAEITDFCIADPSAATMAAVVAAVSHRRVLVFRDQAANDDALVRFLAMLGELTFTAGEIPVAGAPDLNLVSNIGRTTPPRSVFHTDTSYVATPPAFSALRAVLLPAVGGETLFSDQVRAAASLPSSARDRLYGRTLLHSATAPDGSVLAARHPLLRRHPVTGETTLFLTTPARCSALDGVDLTTSARIIAILYQRSIRLAGLYRHGWRHGDIVLWDDRTTMHRASHANVLGDRILHRGLVRGEVPIMARSA